MKEIFTDPSFSISKKGHGKQFRQVTLWLFILFTLLNTVGLFAAESLAEGDLKITGISLTVEPANQTVPISTPTTVKTHFTVEKTQMLKGMVVKAELRGPGLNPLTLTTLPNHTFSIPALSRRGAYYLDSIRLERDGVRLMSATPDVAIIKVMDIVITSVTATPLKLDEIKARGIVITEENFKVYNFSVGIMVESTPVKYDFPVVYSNGDPYIPKISGGSRGGNRGGGGGRGSVKNQTIPFNFKIPTKQNVGGSISTNEEEKLMGLLVFNNDIAFLNQFFSVMFIVANSADSNSGLVLKDLTATLKLPDGLREAETNPPHIMGTGIPVKCPGDDGKLGTADDENFIVGMASGMAEFLAEGKETGNHIVTVDFEGTLSGDNFDTDVPVKGSASGVVVVRNPTYSITFSHPEIIRMGEEYDIYVTMTNTSTVPANMVSLNMNNLIGCRFENKNPEDQPGLRKFDQIAPGQSETAKYRMVSEKTGKVCATAFEADENIAGEIRLTAGVGELNIPLSPDTLILPTHAYKLADIDEEFSEIDPLDRLLNAAMISLGEAYSIAVTPPGGLPEHLPVVDREAVKTRIIELAEAGQRLGFKDTASNTLMVLALDWLGNDYPDLPFDILRRSTTKDAKLSAALARMFNMELNADPKAFQEKFATTCSYKEPFISSILSFNGGPRTARVTLTDYYGNNMTTGDEPLREIPYGQVYGMEDTGQNPVDFALIGSLQQDENDVVNYSQTFEVTGLETGTFDLSLSLPDKNNTLWQVSFSNIQCYKGSRSIITVTSEITQSIITASPGTDKFVLSTDTNGDGTLDSHQDGELVKMEPLALQMISATQDCAADSAGHVAALFFNRPVSRVTAENSDNYFVKNKHIYASFLQPSRRVILVGMDNPISPFVESRIKVENLEDETGSPLAAVEMKIEPTIEVPGGVLFGRVLTANGDPVSGARLMLEEIEEIGEREKTSRSYCVTDIGGNYTFDFVRILRTPFRLTVVDENGKTEEISDRIKYLGEWRQMDIFMRGHGSIKGTVFKSDSTVAPGARVRAYPENASDGVLFLAECDSDGVFSFTGLPVGRVHLHAYFGHEKADDSVDIPEAGALANTEITLAAVQYGHVQGTIEEADGTPIQGVQVLIYRNNRPMNFIETPDENGNFKFENVSVGKFTVKSYHPETGQHIEESREVFAGATTEVRLSFNGYGSVSGTVRDHDNQDLPAVGADVFIPGINLYTKADANGEFRFTRVPLDTRFSIKARHQGSGRETSEEFQVNYGNETSVLLYLPVQGKTGSIEGQIFDEKGSPLVLVNGEAVDIYIIDKSNRRIVSFAHAAADGTFKVTNIYTGTFGVVAVPDSRNSVGVSQAVSVTQTVDGLLRQVDVNLRGKGKLDINVENSDGSASIMADVTVRSDVFRFPNFTTIDSHYKSVSKQQVEIWAGKYTVSAQNGFYDRVSKPGVVADGETDTVTLNMNKLGTIQLTVLDHTGAPVSGAKVSIRAGSYHDDNIVTNANGQFLFTVVPKGGFVIEATDTVDMRFGRYGGEIKSDEPLEATLRLLGWARVKVAVMDADGTPIPASMISSIHLKNTGFPYQTLSQDAATPGEPTNIFNFSNVYQGNFIVSVATLNGLGGRGRGEIKSHGLDVDLNIYLEDWGKVTGKVVKPESGEAVANARVTLLCGDKVFGYCTTSAEGLYSFDYVPKGKVRVKAYDPFTARSGSENGSIAGQNDVEQIDVQLDGLGSVSGTFHDSDGNTVQGGKITLKGNFPDRLYDTTDTTGFFSFSRVPQGDFTVTAVDPSKPSTGTTTGSITSDGQNVPLEIHGSPTLTITGTVHAANGAGAVEGALVTVGKRSDYTDAAGHFTLDYLPYQFQGTYDIEVTYNGDFAYETLTLTTEDLIRDAGTLTLNGFGTVEGTVSDGTGTLADVPVVLEAGSRRFYTTTDTVGKYSFANVNRGTFSVSSSNGTLGAKAYGKFNVDEPTVTMVTVDLLYEESGTVKGRVLSDETAVADVLVQISGNGQTLTQYTDDLGAFHFNYVKLGAKDLIFVGSPGRAKTTTTLNDSEIPLVLEDTHLDGDSPTIKEFDTAGIIKVNFSEPIEETTLTHGFELYTYAEPRVDVQITPDLSEDDTSVTIIPNEILANNTKYLLKIENMVIEDLAGNKMFGGSEISFTTSDTMAPQVVSLSLKEDEPVSLRPSIEIVFDEILRGESVNNQNIIISPTNSAPGGAIDYTVSLDNEGQNATGQKVTISVMQDLQADTEYTLSINGIQDMLTPPNQQTEQITYSFKTEDNINPILQLGVPEGQGTLVKESSKFIVNVSSPHTDIEKVIFTVAGVTLSTVDCNGNLSVTLTAPTLDQLVNTVGFKVTARAFDMAGNRGDDVILDFTLDKDDAPSINIKREGTDPILPGQKVYFTVDAKDDVKLTKLTVKVNGDVLTTCELGQLGLEEVYAVTIPFDASPLLEFNIIATVEDSNMTTNSDSLELKVPEDTAAPTVTLTDPIPYRRFAYNSIIPIQAEANDDLGIKKVRFSIVEEGLPDVLLQEIDGTPGNSFYAYDEYRVEALLEEKDVKIKAEVVDVADKVTVSMVNVTLKKQLNAGDPTVNITTPTTATLVFPGEILPIRAVAFDDNPLDTMQVYIDDQLWVPGVDELLQITPNGVNMSLAALYKVPAHLSAGTQLKIKVAAVEPNDDENSRSYDFVTVVVVEGSIIETEPDIITVIGHADPENPAATYENDTIIIKSGTVAINGVHNYANVLVKETGRLIHSACTDTTAESLSLNVDDGQIVVGPDATIGGTGLGFLGANQEGNNSKNYGRTKGNAAEGSYWESGGSYGGFGGYVTLTSTNRMNELYGSIYFPTEHGSGGGAQTPEGSYSNIGGNGGGVIDLNSNQLIVDGALESNGGEGQSRAGGGSGGSILLEVSQLLGSGVIKAQGGDSGSNGGGGGGRIAIYYDTDNFISDGITVHGGDCRGNATKYKGGAGTIYLKKSGEPGEIIIGNQKDQTGVSGLVANPPGTITDLTADELTDENAQLVPGSLHGMLLQPNVDRTDTFTIISNTATTIRVHLEVGDLDGLTDVAKIEDTYTIKHTADFLLESRSMHIKGHVSVPSLTLDDESTLVVDGKLEVEGLLSLQSGSTLTHSPATVDDEYKLHIKANSINIHVGCSINADARGYIGAAGLDSARTLNNETVGAAQRYAGGSYGGFGGNGNVSGFPNKTYGSITEPTRPGSGGGRSDHYYGGSGGGVIYIEAQELEVNGSISSNGEIAGRSAGSGSGGAIWLSIGTIKGDGTVQANCVSEDTSCNGGGGRIALYYDTADEFDLDSIQALGGNKSDTTPERNGSAGSVYLKQTDGNGRLIIDNKDLITSNSRIFPVISPSTITAISQDGTTLTDESASYMPGSLIGMKLIPDTDEPGITFDIIGNGRTTITLNGNISADTSVETEYRGIAVFNGDVIIRKTRALMEGDFELGSLTVENSTLTHPDTIPGIESYMYMYIKAGNVSIDADSKIDVTASGFAGSIGRDRDGKYQAPYTSGNTTVGGSPILCGGSYGGLGGRYETDVTDLTVPNKTYGSLYQPFEPGSGGGGYDIDYDDPGSNGGGVVRIVAEGMSLEGEILCNGGQIKNKSAGAGSGGSVWLDVTSLSGSGLIQANGGSGTNRGAGGGGRIAVHYNDIDFNTDNIQTYGGIYTPVIPDPNGWYKDQGPIHNGGAGTIYLQNNGGTEEEKNGHLIVDNNGTITEDSSQVFTTPLPAVGLQDSDSLTMTSGMVYVGADSFIPKALSGMKLTTNLDWDATYPIFDNSDNSIHFTDPNEEAITGTSILGLHHFFKLDVKGNARLSTADRITLSSDTNKIVENGSELQTYEQ